MKKTTRIFCVCLLCVFVLSFVSCNKSDTGTELSFETEQVQDINEAINKEEELDEMINLVLDSPEWIKEFQGQDLLDILMGDANSISQVTEINDSNINISLEAGESFSGGIVDGNAFVFPNEDMSQAYLYKIQPGSTTDEYLFSIGYENLWVDTFIRDQIYFESRLMIDGDSRSLSQSYGNHTLQFSYSEDAWYYVLVAFDKALTYTFYVWEDTNPSNFAYIHYDLSDDIDEMAKKYGSSFVALVLGISEASEDSYFNIDSLTTYAFNRVNENVTVNINTYLEKNQESTLVYETEPATIFEPTPVPSIKFVELPTIVSDYEQFLTHVSIEETPDFVTEMETPISSLISSTDDAYYVECNPDRTLNLQLDRPTMPTYTWYINGSHSDKIAEIVIEFDLLETIHPLHPSYFDYDKGYFITLHHFQLIPVAPPWSENPNGQFNPQGRVDVDRNVMIETHEFGEDFRDYAKQEGKHVKITIPYSEFLSTAKDLTLQFLPGTTFANLSVNLWGSNELDLNIVEKISEPVELPERNLLHDAIQPALQIPEQEIIPFSETENVGPFFQMLEQNQVLIQGRVINSDGSINMPVFLYDLGEHADEVQGKYAVIPEGLVPAFMIISSYHYLGANCHEDRQQWNNDKREVIDFVFENMMDESGQFYGVFDIEQGKLVATDRKSPALPILSAMLMNLEQWGVLSDNEIDHIVNSIIANDLIRVGDKLYYAPYGISDDGIMQLKLSDFVISHELFQVFMQYSYDRSRLDDEYGFPMLLEGFSNSLELILEGQEQNMTRLPSTELKVIFTDNGNRYELHPSDTFDINDSFFFMGLRSMPNEMLGVVGYGFGPFPNPTQGGYQGPFSELKFQKTEHSCTKNLSGGIDGLYSEAQKQSIRECEAQYSEFYNGYNIQALYYRSWLHIYNFLQMRTSETAYAPKYNVHTGEMIEASADVLYPEFNEYTAMIKRFGTPITPMNYNLLVGIFNNEMTVRETAHLTMVDFDMYTNKMFKSQPRDFSDPDIFADNGFNIWGYGSFYIQGELPALKSIMPPYNKYGLNFNREDWLQYTMRQVNGKTPYEENLVSIGDDFPLFYGLITEKIITN